MHTVDGDGISMMEAHSDPEIFRIRLGKALDFEFVRLFTRPPVRPLTYARPSTKITSAPSSRSAAPARPPPSSTSSARLTSLKRSLSSAGNPAKSRS